MTLTPLIGLLPNMMRKLLALRLVSRDAPFAEKVACLTEVFGPHLQTIQNMTRSHRDWVMDVLLNPHYLNIILPLDAVIGEIGSRAEVLGHRAPILYRLALVQEPRRRRAPLQCDFPGKLYQQPPQLRRLPSRISGARC